MLIQKSLSKSQKQPTFKAYIYTGVHLATDFGLGMYKNTQCRGILIARLQRFSHTMDVHVMPIYYSSNLRDSFTMVFAQNSSIFHSLVPGPLVYMEGVSGEYSTKFLNTMKFQQ